MEWPLKIYSVWFPVSSNNKGVYFFLYFMLLKLRVNGLEGKYVFQGSKVTISWTILWENSLILKSLKVNKFPKVSCVLPIHPWFCFYFSLSLISLQSLKYGCGMEEKGRELKNIRIWFHKWSNTNFNTCYSWECIEQGSKHIKTTKLSF